MSENVKNNVKSFSKTAGGSLAGMSIPTIALAVPLYTDMANNEAQVRTEADMLNMLMTIKEVVNQDKQLDAEIYNKVERLYEKYILGLGVKMSKEDTHFIKALYENILIDTDIYKGGD